MWVTHTHTLYHASFFDGLHGFFTVFSARFTLFQALEHMNINDLKVEMIDYFPVRRFNHSSYQYWCLNCLGLDPTLLTHSLDLTKNVTRWNRFSAIIETRFDSVASNPTVKGCLGRSGHICIYTYIYIYICILIYHILSMDIREIKSLPKKWLSQLFAVNNLYPILETTEFTSTSAITHPGIFRWVPLSSITCLHILTLLYSTGASTSMSPQKNGYKCFSASLKWLFTASSSRSFAKSILGNQGMPALYLGMWR